MTPRRQRGFGPRLLLALLLASSISAALPTITIAAKPGSGPSPVAISVRKDLDFGDAAGDATLAGTVVLNPTTEIKTVTGGAIDFGGREQVATFRITGEKNTDVFVVLPSTVTVNTSGGTMTLSNFQMDLTNPVNLGGQGRVDIKVGAMLTLQAGQKAGDYTGSFTVSADY